MKLFIFLVLCNLVPTFVFPGTIHIDGEIIDLERDTVTVMLFPYYSYFRGERDAVKFTDITVRGQFSFSLPPVDKACYVSLYLSSGYSPQKSLNFFLIYPGDSIHIIVQKNGMTFFGRGSSKF